MPRTQARKHAYTHNDTHIQVMQEVLQGLEAKIWASGGRPVVGLQLRMNPSTGQVQLDNTQF